MITDHIKNSQQYKTISEKMDKAFQYLQETDLKGLEPGRYELDGDNLFVLIQAYEAKAIEDGKCEAHKKYIDIQYIIDGSELMGYAPVEGMEIVDPYSEAKDRYFVKWEGDLINYSEGMFAIFFPQDAHMPGISNGECPSIKKAVVKIRV